MAEPTPPTIPKSSVDQDDGEAYVTGVSLIPYFEPEALTCRACRFWLRGIAELEAAGVDTRPRIADVVINPDEYYGGHVQ